MTFGPLAALNEREDSAMNKSHNRVFVSLRDMGEIYEDARTRARIPELAPLLADFLPPSFHLTKNSILSKLYDKRTSVRLSNFRCRCYPLAPLDFLPTDAAVRIAVIIVTLLLGETFQRSRRNGFGRLMQSGLIA